MDNSEDSQWPPPSSSRTPVPPLLAVTARESDSVMATVQPFANFDGSQAVDTDEKINVEEESRDHSSETSQNAEDPTPGLRRMSTSLPNIAFCQWPDATQEDMHAMAQNEVCRAPAKTMPHVVDPEFADEPENNSRNAEALPSSLAPIQDELRGSHYPLFVMVAPNEVPMDCLQDVVLVEVSDYERWIMCFALPLDIYTARIGRDPPRGLMLEHWPNVDEVSQEHKMRQYKLKKPPVPTVAVDRFAFHQFIASRPPPPSIRDPENFEEARLSTDSEAARQLEREFGIDGASRLIPMNLGGHFPAYLRLSPWQPAQRRTQNSAPASNSSSRTVKAPGGTRLDNQWSRPRGQPGGQQPAGYSCSTYTDDRNQWSKMATPNQQVSAAARLMHQSQLYPGQTTFHPSHSRQNTNATHQPSYRGGRLVPLANATMADNRGRASAPQRQASSALGRQATNEAYGNQQPHHTGQRALQPQSSRPDPAHDASQGGARVGPRQRTAGSTHLCQPSHAQEHWGLVVAPSSRSNINENHNRGGTAALRTQAPWQSSACQRSQSLQRTAAENNNQHNRPVYSTHGTDGAFHNEDLQWQSVGQRPYGPRQAPAGYDTRGRAPAPAQYASEARPMWSSDTASRYQPPQAQRRPAQHSSQRSQNTHLEGQYDVNQNSRPTAPRPAADGMRHYGQIQSEMTWPLHGTDNRYQDGRSATHRTTQLQPGKLSDVGTKRISTDSGFGANDDWAY